MICLPLFCIGFLVYPVNFLSLFFALLPLAKSLDLDC